MRYAKGSLVISRDRDVPLLRQVRDSKFVSHNQLFDFMRIAGVDHDRDSFNWRVRRLRQFAHVSVCAGIDGADSSLYRITKKGLNLLEHCGDYRAVLNSNTEHLPHPSHAFHALEINDINLALARENLLANWQSEIEIASFNTVSASPFRKDYDAIVTVWVEQRQARFALEYERSIKKARDYARIRESLEAESEIDCILYLTSGPDVLTALLHELSSSGKKIAFASAKTFQRDLLATNVICSGSAPAKFRDLL
jgi:hypothetical protein